MKHYMNEYRNAMDSLQLSNQQQESLFRAAVREATQEKTHRSVSRRAMAGIVLASVLALTACGIALKTASEAFAPVFGDSTSQKAVMDEIGTQLGTSATDNGVTITADAVIGDDHQAWIMYTLSWGSGTDIDLPEGIPQSPDEYAAQIPDNVIQFESCSDWSVISHDQFFDSDPNDNAIEFFQRVPINQSTVVPVEIHPYTVEFENLQFCGTDPYGNPLDYDDESVGSWETIIEGNWQLSFDIEYESAAVSVPLEGKESFELNGYTCEITNLSVSPISAFVEYSYTRTDADKPITTADDEIYDDIEKMYSNFYITTTSGQIYHTNATWGDNQFLEDSNSYSFSAGGSFTEIIPLDEIESVTVGNVTYKVPHTAS
ncbi:MAG: DUF4179 domain-containing protein [Clostridia bacterium]|nr:DUF4179 domain-containing protein [Clostridia bacterium]